MHRLVRSTWLAASLTLGCAFGAWAMDIATYDKQRKEATNSQTQVRLRVYLLGLGEGLRLANAALQQQSLPPLFCAPDQPPLLGDDYKRLIDLALGEARGTLERQDTSIEIILLRALQEKYVCPATRPASG